MIGGSSSVFATPFPTVESIHDDMIERSSYDPYDMENLQATSGSVKTGKWTAPAAAKMRITRKTSDSGVGGAAKKPRRRAQAYEDHNHSSSMNQPLGVIRVCSDCNTTKTPLWRSGPCGPKSLCNACGIRQRKARRAMMASGASTDGAKVGTPSDAATAHPKVKKEKRADVDRSLPFKKRCKLVVQDHTATTAAAADDKAIAKSAEVVNWGKSSAAAAACFRSSPAFAVQDEITDAAMLLMTLSCGLVRS